MMLEEPDRTSPFHAGAESAVFAPYFNSASYLNMLPAGQVPVGCVTFTLGYHNHWHIHCAVRGNGQILFIIAGWG